MFDSLWLQPSSNCRVRNSSKPPGPLTYFVADNLHFLAVTGTMKGNGRKLYNSMLIISSISFLTRCISVLFVGWPKVIFAVQMPRRLFRRQSRMALVWLMIIFLSDVESIALVLTNAERLNVGALSHLSKVMAISIANRPCLKSPVGDLHSYSDDREEMAAFTNNIVGKRTYYHRVENVGTNVAKRSKMWRLMWPGRCWEPGSSKRHRRIFTNFEITVHQSRMICPRHIFISHRENT